MYLISRSTNLELPIRDQKIHYTPKGDVDHVEKPLAVKFKHAGNVPPYAREAVSRLANWGVGLGEHEDPFTRCGAVDTEAEQIEQGWTDEEREVVENALMKAGSNGIEYIIVEAPATVAPWSKYDEIEGEQAADEITYYSEKLGIDPGTIRQYELENQKRPEVIAAMDRLVEKQNEDIVGVISV